MSLRPEATGRSSRVVRERGGRDHAATPRSLVYVSRVLRLPLLDDRWTAVGRVMDLVIGAPPPNAAPPLLGFVADVARRRIFVASSRAATVDTSGVRLRASAVDLNPYVSRPWEVAVTRLLGRRIGEEAVLDVGLRSSGDRARPWTVATVVLASRARLRLRQPTRTVAWNEVAELFAFGPLAEQVGSLRELGPTDAARVLQAMPDAHRVRVAEGLSDDDLAAALEELPEADRKSLFGILGRDRAALVLGRMEPDDAVDLLALLPAGQQAQLLADVAPDAARSLRQLLVHAADTAGGLMTSDAVIVPPYASVAEALVRMRTGDRPLALAALAFVTEPPNQTPTGRYLGAVEFRRLLRERPGTLLASLADGTPSAARPGARDVDVTKTLAAYNLLAIPVCDDAGLLLGVISVDDALDRVLPKDWRSP